MAVDWLALSNVAEWTAGWVVLGRVRGLGSAEADAVPPSVSVVVPARDEAHALPTLLAALAGQTLRPHEVIVVDDHSSDGTGALAVNAGVRTITAEPLPDGWTGKSWACWQGARAASGEILVFLDADTEPAPDLLARLVAERDRRGGLVSVEPYHRMERPYERCSAFFNILATMGVGLGSMRPDAEPAGAFGPCIAVHRDDYETVGGHEAVRAAVLEDIALAARFRDAGLPISCLGGKGSIRYRMYPLGMRQLVEGWSKNFAAGAGSTPVVRLILIAGWLGGVMVATWAALQALAGAVAGPVAPPLWGVVLYVAFASQIGVMLRQLGNYGWWPAVLFPIGLAVFIVVFARSIVLTLVRREVRWKGRRISTRGARSP